MLFPFARRATLSLPSVAPFLPVHWSVAFFFHYAPIDSFFANRSHRHRLRCLVTLATANLRWEAKRPGGDVTSDFGRRSLYSQGVGNRGADTSHASSHEFRVVARARCLVRSFVGRNVFSRILRSSFVRPVVSRTRSRWLANCLSKKVRLAPPTFLLALARVEKTLR